MVGRTARCNHPLEASHVPAVGPYMSPDPERIIDLKPDLVLAPKDGTKKRMVTRLTDLGIPVFVEDCRNLDDISDLIQRLGRILDREREAARTIEQFDQQRKLVRERIQARKKPSVLFAVGSSPLVVVGGKSFLGCLIREAGGINVAENERIPFPKLSIEEVITKDPDIILVLDKELPKERCIETWSRHRSLKAVREGRIHVMNADLLARPSPRIVDGLRQLARIFHPSAFPRDE